MWISCIDDNNIDAIYYDVVRNFVEVPYYVFIDESNISIMFSNQ